MGPEEWQWQAIEDCTSKCRSGYWGSDKADQGLVECLVIRNGDVSSEGIAHRLPRRYVKERDFKRARVNAGDVILTTSGYCGTVAYVDQDLAENPVIASNFVRLLRPNGLIDGRFLYYSLSSDPIQRQLDSWVGGTAIKNLKTAAFRSVEVAVPPLPEQRKIAAILSSVDDSIAATRKVIDQTKRVKQGLLQTLMTRGIGQTRFKKTEIGEIPETWEVVPLESLLARSDNAMRSGPFGSALLKEELVPDGIPLLGIDNIHEEEFRPCYSRFVSPEKFRELQRYAVRPRDVVITIMGTVGRTCVLPADMRPALSSKHLWTMTFDPDRYIPELISLQLNWAPWVQRHFKSQSQGGIMKAIRSDVLKTTPLPLPSLEEQTRIATILESWRTVESTAVRGASSLEELKRGLMQDLLTGRVRVQPD